MTNISKGKRSSAKLKSMGDHDAFLSRITKSLYYSRLPMTDRLSLPVTEFAAELFTEVKSGLTLERLDVEEAGRISRNACVSPCSLVLALLYLERLKDCNPEYLHRVAPSELFLVSLMVASKFLNDDGEEDEVFNMEWAKSGDLTVGQVNRLEKEFLGAIDWAIFVQNHDFWDRLRKLEMDIAYKEARKRGWFSYTELSCLLENVPLAAMIHAFVSVSSICLATYAAGVVTLLGSVLVASQMPGTSLAPPRQSSSLSSSRVGVSPNFTDSLPTASDEVLDATETDVENAQIITERITRNFDLSSRRCGNFSRDDCSNFRTKKRNATVEYVGWEWWLSSIMTWLPEYSKLTDGISRRNAESNDDYSGKKTGIESLEENDKLQRTGAFITNSQLFGDDSYMREAENLIMEINWKETLTSNFDVPSNDWRYFATKISIGHRH